jgi:hypothetical protein
MLASHRTLAVVFVAACLALPLASRVVSAPQGPPPPVRPVWPPHASNILNLDSTSVANPNGYVSLNPGTSVMVYTVPSDRYLVLTDFEITEIGANMISLFEDANGSTTVKRGFYFNQRLPQTALQPYHSAVGLTFAPGSSVVLRNTTTQGQQTGVAYTMTGYFAAP